jgi:hypothetical protein
VRGENMERWDCDTIARTQFPMIKQEKWKPRWQKEKRKRRRTSTTTITL